MSQATYTSVLFAGSWQDATTGIKYLFFVENRFIFQKSTLIGYLLLGAKSFSQRRDKHVYSNIEVLHRNKMCFTKQFSSVSLYSTEIFGKERFRAPRSGRTQHIGWREENRQSG